MPSEPEPPTPPQPPADPPTPEPPIPAKPVPRPTPKPQPPADPPAAPPAPAPEPPKDSPATVDKSAFEALQAELEAERARNAELKAEHETAVSDLATRVAQVEAERAEERRGRALDELGVLDKYRAFAPKADPTTAAGKATLEQWAAEHPELCRKAEPTAVDPATTMDSLFGDKATKSPFAASSAFRESLVDSLKAWRR